MNLLQQDIETLAKDTTHLSELNYFKVKKGMPMRFGQYRDVAQYDSVQNSLPEKDRNSWFECLLYCLSCGTLGEKVFIM